MIYQMDCLNLLTKIEPCSIDLILTSPPYASKRRNSGVSADKYVYWMLERTEGFKQVLKPTGSFIMNIKEGAVNGQRELYVMDLVLAMVRQQNWLFVEEYIWHKTNAAPGKWPNRFRDAWEHCYHFTKQKQFSMYQKEVMIPIGNWAKPRLKTLSDTDQTRHNSSTGSGIGRRVSNWIGRNMVYPTNVLRLSGEASNREHNAAFPERLPEWFIKLFTVTGDTVLDPFVGSGTTCVAAQKLARHWIGIDENPKNCEIANNRLKNLNMLLI